MSRRTLVVDIDNTLADYTGALRRWCDRAYPGHPCPEPGDYDFEAADGWPWSADPALTFHDCHADAVRDGLYLDEEPYPGAIPALQGLHKAGWSVIIATSRTDDPLRPGPSQTERWLDRRHVPHDGLVFTADKWLVPADAYVDDDPRAIAAIWLKGQRVYHPGHPYDHAVPGVPYGDWDGLHAMLDAYMGRKER